MRSTNSSPPKRAATWFDSAASRLSRSATATSSLSPMWWPRLSLTALNASRSMKQRPIRMPGAAWRKICSSRSANRARFGRPVSRSCSAAWRNRASLRRSASSACSRATSAAARMASCSSRVRSRRAQLYPVARAPSSRAVRCPDSLQCSTPASSRRFSPRYWIVAPSASGAAKSARTNSLPTSYPGWTENGSATSAVESRSAKPSSVPCRSTRLIGT
jgi:hypothetical protein